MTAMLNVELPRTASIGRNSITGARYLVVETKDALALARQLMEAMRPIAEERAGKVMRPAKDTSRAAALAVAPATGTQRSRVLEAIRFYGSMTDEEIGDRLKMHQNSIRPRRLELVEGGHIVDSGIRKTTRSGNPAIVWRLAPSSGDEAVPALFDKD